MGLDTSHDCWHGGYHSFNVWRNKLSEVAGYQIKDYDGIPATVVDWDNYNNNNLAGKWDKTPDDPLIVLIVHYDCDGSIYPKQARALADRIESLIPLLPQDDFRGYPKGWREVTQQFVDGLRKAAKARQVVVFS